MMIKPGKSPVFDNPADFGLDYEDVEFETRDGTTLRGWLIKGGSDRVVIETHFGVQCSRSGYSPKGKGMVKMWKRPISFLRQAKYLNDKGYTVLMYDMRNHGDSDLGEPPWVSWGPGEALDVIAAVEFITAHEEYADAEIGLLSICMGAAASTYAFGLGEQGLTAFPQIKAMVAVQPLHYNDFVKAFGVPRFMRGPGARVSQKRLGLDLRAKTYLDDVSSVSVPTLVMQNRNDPWTNVDFVQEYYDGLEVEKEILWVDLEKKRAASYEYLGTNPDDVLSFFDRYVGGESSS